MQSGAITTDGWCARRILAVGMLVAVLTPATPVSAQGIAPVLYPATSSGGCQLTDSQGLVTLDVAVVGPTAIFTRGVQFRIASAGFSGVVVSSEFTPGNSGVGSAVDGFMVEYAGCVKASGTVVRLTYQMFGTSSACATIELLPFPGDQSIMAWDCNFELVPTHALGPITVNPTAQCSNQWCILATKESTWGQVKSLYR